VNQITNDAGYLLYLSVTHLSICGTKIPARWPLACAKQLQPERKSHVLSNRYFLRSRRYRYFVHRYRRLGWWPGGQHFGGPRSACFCKQPFFRWYDFYTYTKSGRCRWSYPGR